MRIAPLLLLLLASCSAGPDRLREILGTAHYFQVGNVRVGARSEHAPRVERYVRSLHAAMKTYFRPSPKTIEVFVYDTREELTPDIAAICRTDKDFGRTMGFYHEPTRSVLCSMQWGLGWLGDLVLRAWMKDDWKDAPAPPGKWFEVGFVSMLYNCFRTPTGEFHGLNVASYYRPQVQRTIEDGEILPLKDILTDNFGEELIQNDFVRREAREFLAYLHAHGLLANFYEAYRKGGASSGIGIAETLLGKSLGEIEKDWLRWMAAADGEIGDSEMAKPFPVLGILIERKEDEAEPGIGVFLACPNSPALRAGMKSGDRILEIDSRRINSYDDLVKTLQGVAYGSTVAVLLTRGEIRVTLDRLIDG